LVAFVVGWALAFIGSDTVASILTRQLAYGLLTSSAGVARGAHAAVEAHAGPSVGTWWVTSGSAGFPTVASRANATVRSDTDAIVTTSWLTGCFAAVAVVRPHLVPVAAFAPVTALRVHAILLAATIGVAAFVHIFAVASVGMQCVAHSAAA
jgi:hypothetical protein